MRNVFFQEETNPIAPHDDRTQLFTREDLKLLGPLMSGPVDLRRRQEADLVGGIVKAHQLIDKRSSRRRSRLPVL